jgi:hypothetical protein
MFDPYGKVTICNPDGSEKTGVARVCSAFGNPFFFTGRRNDDETRWFDSSKPAGKEWQQGLMQFRNRMYDVGLGRFVSRDPLGYVDGYGLQGAYFVPGGLDPQGTVTGQFSTPPQQWATLIDMDPWVPGAKPGTMPDDKHGKVDVAPSCIPTCICVGHHSFFDWFTSSVGLFEGIYKPQFDWNVSATLVLHTSEDTAAWALTMNYLDDADGVFKNPSSTRADREKFVRWHEDKHIKDAKASYDAKKALLDLMEKNIRTEYNDCMLTALRTCALVSAEVIKDMNKSKIVHK